jgi:beta-N-acetylhexosaminidase
VTCLDSTLPATLSPTVLTGYLRNNIGFDGVCMTDSMGMGALTSLGYTNDQECAMAIEAGNDLVLSPNSLTGAISAVQSAVSSGAITQARLDQSVMRILKLKRRYGLFVNPYVDPSATAGIVGSADHRATELAVARAGITLVRNTGGVLPLNLNSGDNVLLVTVTSTSDAASRFASYVTAKHSNTTSMSIGTSPSSTQRTSVVNAAASAAVVIIATYEAQNYSNQTTLVNQLIATGKPIICVGQGKPYELQGFTTVPAYLCAYSYRSCSFAAAADVIFGDYNPGGLLPVSVPGTSYAFGWGLTY